MRVGRLMFPGLLLLVAVGCRYDGAFMQMDSNAPFPFFGFQLAVDSGVRPPHSADGDDSRAKWSTEERVPLRDRSADSLDVPVPRLQRQPNVGMDQGIPSLLVKGGARSGKIIR